MEMVFQDLGGLSCPAPFDVEACREKLRAMTDAELISFGKQMHDLVYPRTYDFYGKPTVSAFSIQLDEARAEWRRRYPKVAKIPYPRFTGSA